MGAARRGGLLQAARAVRQRTLTTGEVLGQSCLRLIPSSAIPSRSQPYVADSLGRATPGKVLAVTRVIAWVAGVNSTRLLSQRTMDLYSVGGAFGRYQI
jgi:hypothetical protein